MVTRGFPLEPRPGERVDHPHHVGLWFNHGDVNGVDFWNNSESLRPEHAARVARALEEPAKKPEVFTDANGKPTTVPVLDNAGVNGVYTSSEGVTRGGGRGDAGALGPAGPWDGPAGRDSGPMLSGIVTSQVPVRCPHSV